MFTSPAQSLEIEVWAVQYLNVYLITLNFTLLPCTLLPSRDFPTRPSFFLALPLFFLIFGMWQCGIRSVPKPKGVWLIIYTPQLPWRIHLYMYYNTPQLDFALFYVNCTIPPWNCSKWISVDHLDSQEPAIEQSDSRFYLTEFLLYLLSCRLSAFVRLLSTGYILLYLHITETKTWGLCLWLVH